MLNKQQFIFILLLALNFSAFGQKGTKNPYSVLGLGELQTEGYTPYASMGNISMGAMDSTTINENNPASYSYLGRNQPVFQVGFSGKFSNFSTASSSGSSEQYFGLNQFQMGIPIKKNWGAVIGLKPYAFRGYTVANYSVLDSDTASQSINEGSGAISNVFFGLAYRPVNHTSYDTIFRKRPDTSYVDTLYISKKHQLSIGTNINYLFGAVTQTRSLEYFPLGFTNFDPYNSRVVNSLRLSDANFDFGINYAFTKNTPKRGEKTPAKSRTIAVGLTYSPGIDIRAYQDLLAYSYQGSFYEGVQIFIGDTVQNISNNEGSLYIPEEYKFGFEYRKNPTADNDASFRWGVDVNFQAWSKYTENFTNGLPFNQLNDRLFIGTGIEYTPNTKPVVDDPFLSRLHYRLGLNYTQMEYSILNSSGSYYQINNYGMSFGFGIPLPGLKRSNSNVNFGVSLGNLGTTDNGLIREQYLGVYFGLSMTPGLDYAWFRKRLYN